MKNLPDQSRVTVQETSFPGGYAFKQANVGQTTSTSLQNSVLINVNDGKEQAIEYINTKQATPPTPEVTSVTVSKRWAGDETASRPASVQVTLGTREASGVFAALTGQPTATLNSDNNWSYTWTNLPKKADGQEIAYWVQETVPSNYTAAVTGSVAEGFTITNTYTPTTSVSVTKVWSDSNNQDGIRPEKITVNLLANGEKVDGKSITLPQNNQWSYTWTDLPEKSGGQTITYTVSEEAVEGYSSSVSGDAASGFTITNSHTPETTSVSVTKVWSDGNNQDGKRPASVTVRLHANGEEKASATLNAQNNWTYQWTNLDKNSDGEAITYTVSEDSVTGYSSSISGNAASGFTITNSYTPATTSVTVRKFWEDSNDQDGKRPDSVQVTLCKQSADGTLTPINGKTLTLSQGDGTTAAWAGYWRDLPKYENGTEIKYWIKEENVPDGYTASVRESGGDLVLTNSYTPGTTSVSVTKAWSDSNNQDGIRPEKITVHLLANGEKVDGKSITLPQNNQWSYTWTNLPEKSGGQTITYTVSEETVEEYSSNVSGNAASGFTITNSHTTATTSVSVTKVWSDGNNQDGKRPDSVTVRLHADGTEKASATLNAQNNWTYQWTNLDEKSGGKTINYTVTEDAVTEYSSSISGNAASGFTITNSHTTATTSVSVTKEWSDNNNQDGIRPDSVTVRLYADGKEVNGKSITLPQNGQWSYTWTDLPRNSGGQTINYTVEEASVTGYTSNVSGNATIGYTITNSHTTATTSVSVTKVWEDNDNRLGKRPALVLVQLTANGSDMGTAITLSADNNWAYQWQNLAQKSNGQTIVYGVRELSQVEHYTAEVSKKTPSQFVITNTCTASAPPQTGDNTPLALWLGLVWAALGSMVALLSARKKESR